MTAVQWALDQQHTLFALKDLGGIDDYEYFNRSAKILEKAMEMEKKQSECICVNVIEMILNESEQGKEINSKEIFEQCYNETFK
jgi:hypothetical protein